MFVLVLPTEPLDFVVLWGSFFLRLHKYIFKCILISLFNFEPLREDGCGELPREGWKVEHIR